MFVHLLDATEVGNAYCELQERVSQLLAAQPLGIASAVVPHCPNWTVLNVLSHMVGVPEDVMARRME